MQRAEEGEGRNGGRLVQDHLQPLLDGLLEDALDELAQDGLVVREGPLDDEGLFLHDDLDLVDQRLQAWLDARRVRVWIGKLIPRLAVHDHLVGDELVPVDEELVLVHKGGDDAGAAVEVVEHPCALHHVLKVLAAVAVVELLEQVLFQQLRKLLECLPCVVSAARASDAVGDAVPAEPVGRLAPRRQVEPLADAHQLARNDGAPHLVLGTPLALYLLERRQLARLGDLHPALDQEVGVLRFPPFPVEFLELLADLHGNVPPSVSAAVPVRGGGARVVERQVEGLELGHGLVELAAEGLEGLVVLDLGTADLRQELRLLLLQLLR